ncbi:MAG: DEAD/DEAH box helicase family protein [Clostridia bacterium]|nr:DEAD/DEAH box helicase family protein [Clostridia bacterium]
MKELKNYQEEAIEELLTYSKFQLKKDSHGTIVFQSPTGSGKTFMMSHYMQDLAKEIDEDICFLWISVGKGELQKQSYKSVKREIDDKITCHLIEDEFFGGRESIEQNEAIFINWQKIRTKDKKTGEFINIVMKQSEGNSFPEVLENTRKLGRKIILIIDESHADANTERAMELRDEIIVPDLTIEMSATPVIKDSNAKVEVNPNDVILEGMIKKEIIINNGIDKIFDDEMDSQRLILESAYAKREALAKKYRENGIKVNPLVLIQIPNSDAGDLKKEATMKFLEEKGITRENGRLGIYLDGDTADKNSDELLPLDGKIEYLIFKMAIDTGWDCPRAQILVKFRETKSIVFEIQTVGRILRMPEAKHYSDEELNRAFVYTNIQSIAIKKEVYNPNIIKTLVAKRKASYKPTPIKSYYRNRIDFGDVTSSFYNVFERAFCNYFDIRYVDDSHVPDAVAVNEQKMMDKGVITQYFGEDGIPDNVIITTKDIDKRQKIDSSMSLFSIPYSKEDLQIVYEKIIKENLNGFAPKRSIPTVKSAILKTYRKYLHIEASNGGIMYIQNMFVTNENILGEVIKNATDNYKKVHEEEVNAKHQGETNLNWEIEPEKNYNSETYTEVKSKLSLYQPLYIELKNGKVNKLEKDFIEYLDEHDGFIEWFWKNGQEHMKTNFGIEKKDGTTFQPDFIIKFKDGRIGIFDTKAVGFNEADNEEKALALQQFQLDEYKAGRGRFECGLVIFEDGKFRYFDTIGYESYKKDKSKWKMFDELFN